MFKKKQLSGQGSLWTVSSEIVQGPGFDYYNKLDNALKDAKFDVDIRKMCEPYYSSEESNVGRKGIDPYVYFKMIMVGFFENIGSERGIANRCADSLSIRSFLKYELTQTTPDHSTLCKIRQRLGMEVYDKAFAIILNILSKNKLLKGKKVGVDTSVIEANASMRKLVNNHSGETYDEYVKKLAQEAGVDEENPSAVRTFDKKRKNKTMSNEDWHNPNDPDAKIGPTKQGKVKLIYKEEHIVDMESGAIIKTTVLPGHQPDPKDLATHIEQAQNSINEAKGYELTKSTIEQLTADKGYFNIEELGKLQSKNIRTVVQDCSPNRNLKKLSEEEQQVVKRSARSVRTKYGITIRKRRGEFLERSFTHVLDNGDLRKATLRKTENLQKRNLIACMCCNLSLYMRKTYKFGTPKQEIAVNKYAKNGFFELFKTLSLVFQVRVKQIYLSRIILQNNVMKCIAV